MMKWIVKRYLNKKLENLNFQILSLEQELGYVKYIERDEETKLLEVHKQAVLNRDSLRHIINKII